MSRKIWIGLGLVVLLAVSAILLERVSKRPVPSSAELEKARAQERQSLSSGFKLQAESDKGKSISWIGDLTHKRYWTEILPLALEQVSTITKLNDLVSKSRAHSCLIDADYLDSSPTDFQEYLARSEMRRRDAIWHAQRMVDLGLLTEPQAALVIQRRLRGRNAIAPHDELGHELLGFTKGQQDKLAQVEAEAKARNARLNWFAVDPEKQKEHRVKRGEIKQEHASATMAILTPKQLKAWSQLTVERSSPAEPPELPALSDAEAARAELLELSPVFRLMSKQTDTLELDDEQQRLLADLEQVTELGLLWISVGDRKGPFPSGDPRNDPDDPIGQTRAEFLKHAEQVALLGILTEQQVQQ